MVVKDTIINRLPEEPALPDDDRPIWEIILQSGPNIPPEERAAAPHDGARNYKHYLYSRNVGKRIPSP